MDLSALMAQQLALDRELLEQRGQQLVSALTPGITVPADASLLGKAVGNLLSNASRYSPEGAEIRVWCGGWRPPRPECGEHRERGSAEMPCPTCLKPFTGRRVPGTGAPAERSGTLSGKDDPRPARGGVHHREHGGGCESRSAVLQRPSNGLPAEGMVR